MNDVYAPSQSVVRKAKLNDFSRMIIERCVNCCREVSERAGVLFQRAAVTDVNTHEKRVEYLERLDLGGQIVRQIKFLAILSLL